MTTLDRLAEQARDAIHALELEVLARRRDIEAGVVDAFPAMTPYRVKQAMNCHYELGRDLDRIAAVVFADEKVAA